MEEERFSKSKNEEGEWETKRPGLNKRGYYIGLP